MKKHPRDTWEDANFHPSQKVSDITISTFLNVCIIQKKSKLLGTHKTFASMYQDLASPDSTYVGKKQKPT